MFDNRNDPEHLLASLEEFLRIWHTRNPRFCGIAPEKLSETVLPDPLRRLYAFAGSWPGDNGWGSLFAYQDNLCPFELLRIHDDKLLFAWENQAVWLAGTLPEGKDPPVSVCFDERTWQPLCGSLAQFLVTLCLHETVFGCKHHGHGENPLARLAAKGKHVSPIWLDGPYVDMVRSSLGLRSFHLVDQNVLVMDDHWCGTNSEADALSLPDIFKSPREPDPEFRTGKPLWEIPSVPMTMKKVHLDSLARQHDAQVNFHSAQADNYRRIAASLEK